MPLSGNAHTETYCAFCKTGRRVYRKKSLSPLDFLLISSLCGLIMWLLVQSFDPRVIIFLVMALVAAETTIHFRWRLALVCRHCGFDPVLYLKSPDKAAARVRFHLDTRQEAPEALFGPALQLPKRKRSRDQEAGGTLSRHA